MTTATETVAFDFTADLGRTIAAMRSDDRASETSAVNFVRSAVNAMLYGAFTVEGIAANVIAAFKIATPTGKASKATLAGVKAGVMPDGRGSQYLATRLATADFAVRNHNAAPAVVAAFLDGDKSVKSVAALQRAIETAIAAAVIPAIVEPEAVVEPVAPLAAVVEPVEPIALTFAQRMVAFAAEWAADTSPVDDATTDAFAMLMSVAADKSRAASVDVRKAA